jgi:hypothetical protein
MGFNLTPMVKNLLLINVGVLLMMYVTRTDLVSILGLRYINAEQFQPYQIFTHMFMHVDLMHLFFNMLVLLILGPMLEHVWGSKRFLAFYLICGLGAAVLFGGVLYYEMQQLEKSLLQRELEHWHERRVELESAAILSGDEMPKDDKQELLQQRDIAARQVENFKAELREKTKRTADLSAKIERIDHSVSVHQRWLEAVERAKYEARTPDPPPMNLEQFRQAVTLQIEQMHRELNAQKAENAELKKQLEQRDERDEIAP